MADYRTPKPKERDAYFQRQWEESQADDKKRDDARRRRWLDWVKEQSGRAPYSAWLVIPCNLTDYGARPLASGTPYWASPFIGVQSPDPSGQPLAGAPNFLYAQVFNLGAATAAPTRVDFYWCDPSVGLGAADAHFVGYEWVEIPPMHSKVVVCSTPWTPTYLNAGHECAFAICDNHVLDPLLHPFEPWADRHVGQRNLHVLPAVQQMFFLWAPMGRAGLPAQLRMTALRGIAPKGFAQRRTAYATLSHAAHEVMRGLAREPVAARRELPSLPAPRVFAQMIDVGRVVRGVRALDETRAMRGGADTMRPHDRGTLDAAELGELGLELAVAPGTMARVAIEIAPLDLAMNEIVVLNVVHVAAGAITGGYTLVLAHPGWFKDSPLVGDEGGAMQEWKDRRLEMLVVEQNAQARITYQLVKQLADHLPIASFERLAELVPDVVVDNHRLPIKMFAPYAGKEAFPIEHVEDLVRKMSAATRIAIATTQARSTNVTNPAATAVLAGLEGEPGRRPAIPAGHFTGPSIYGSTRAKGG